MALSKDSLFEDENRERIRFVVIAISILLVASLLICLRILSSDLNDVTKWEDVSHYYRQFMDFADGKIPYSDFDFEYPPLMLLFISIPGLFSHDFAVYTVVFMFMVVLFYILTAYYLNRITEMMNVSNRILFLILLATLVFLYAKVFLRNDIFAMFFIVASLYYYLRKDYSVSFVLIALGTMTKIFPIVIAIALILPFVYRKQFQKLIKYVAISAGVCLLLTIPFLINDSGLAFAYLTYHVDRGLQVESIAASIIDTFNLWFDISTQDIGYGSYNITGAIPDAVAKILTPLMIVAFLAVSIWCVRKRKGSDAMGDDRLVIALCSLFIMMFVVFNKVFSAQYMLWIMMMFSLVLCLEPDKDVRIRLTSLSVLTLALTYLVSDTLSVSVNNLEAMGTVVLLLRNILVVVLFVVAIRQLYEKYGQETQYR